MDETQKILIKAGRKDLAQKYYEKVAKSSSWEELVEKIKSDKWTLASLWFKGSRFSSLSGFPLKQGISNDEIEFSANSGEMTIGKINFISFEDVGQGLTGNINVFCKGNIIIEIVA